MADTVHVRKHIAPLTGQCWFIVADNESGLQVSDTVFYSDYEDAAEEAERINALPTIEELLKKAIDGLPEKTQLIYVDYRDQLTDEQIAFLLEGDTDKVWESFWEWESDNRYESVKYLLRDVLDADEAERLMDDDEAWETFRQECEERDESDPLADLMRNTPAIMIRYSLGHDVEPYSWQMTEDEQQDQMLDIANVAGIDFEENKKALWSLVVEASYGGSLCVLHRSDIEDVVKVQNGGTVIFTDPFLLVYDGLNGSGHMEEVKGTVTVEITPETMRHDAGRYSWSDDIAGIVHSACETPAEFINKEVNA